MGFRRRLVGWTWRMGSVSMRVAIFKINHCGSVTLLPTISLFCEKTIEYLDEAKQFCQDTIPDSGLWLISTDGCETAIVQNGQIVAHSRF